MAARAHNALLRRVLAAEEEGGAEGGGGRAGGGGGGDAWLLRLPSRAVATLVEAWADWQPSP